jgi:hypothetical protein
MEMLKMLDLRISNTKRLSDAMNDYHHGVITEQTDMRSTFDKLNDLNFMENEFRNKVYRLFGNDTTQSESFMKKFNNANMSIEDFNIVYSKLSELFKGTLAPYSTVYNNMIILIDNIKTTGNPSQSARQAAGKGDSRYDNDMARNISNEYEDEDLVAAQRGARNRRKNFINDDDEEHMLQKEIKARASRKAKPINEDKDLLSAQNRARDRRKNDRAFEGDYLTKGQRKNRDAATSIRLTIDEMKNSLYVTGRETSKYINDKFLQRMVEAYATKKGITEQASRLYKNNTIADAKRELIAKWKLSDSVAQRDATTVYEEQMVVLLNPDAIQYHYCEIIKSRKPATESKTGDDY